jgi:hypothetical protein
MQNQLHVSSEDGDYENDYTSFIDGKSVPDEVVDVIITGEVRMDPSFDRRS